jgi:hypothetical protein
MRSLLPYRLPQFMFCIVCLVISRTGKAQTEDSINWVAHFRQPDSVMVQDTILFPYDEPFQLATYTARDDQFRWAGRGARSDGDFQYWYTAEITLQADHRFVFELGREGPGSLTVGRWWNTSDSAVCLQWDGLLSLRLCKDSKAYSRYFYERLPFGLTYWPMRIDHWQFLRRGDSLVPWSGPKATVAARLIDCSAINPEQWVFQYFKVGRGQR